jgi:hypothetical protein
METIQRAAKLYVFKDISKSSPSPIFAPMNIDLDAELEKIRNTNYTSEFKFNQDLTSLFTRFRDGHLAYVPPSCYSGFPALQPFALVSYFDKELQQEQIYVADITPNTNDAYQELIGSDDLSKHIGSTVTHINGVPAVKEILQFANSSIGSSRDINGRYNLAVARFIDEKGIYALGTFFARGSTSPIPKTGEKIEYVLEKNGVKTTLSFPWITVPSRDVSSYSALVEECNASPKSVDKKEYDGSLLDEVMFGQLSLAAQKHFAYSSSSDVSLQPLLIATDIQFYQINNKTAVIRFPSFMAAKRVEFVRALKDGFQLMADKDLHRVIVDVSNNGGGNICLGYTLARMLISEYNPYGANDLPVVPLSLAYAQAAIDNDVHDTYWSPDMWYKANADENVEFNMDWFAPGVNHTRGGVEGTYSSLIRDGCDLYFDKFNPPREFKPSQIKIITNGYCASTCALFTRHLQEYQKVMTHAIGGISYVPMAIANCPGGQVNDMDTTITMATKLGMKDHPLSPPGFPNTARMTYTLREVYPWQKTARDIPLEFFFQPATYHLSYTKESAVNPQKAWEQVLELFD